MSQKEQSQKDFIVFAEAGFIAINQGDEEGAKHLFRAAQLLRPENTLPQIGLGYMHFLKLELRQASEIFAKITEIEPANEMAKALLGLSIALTPNEANKGEKILEETVKSQDPTIKTMSGTAIEFIEKYVKKNPHPAVTPPRKRK
jgi:Flp pilus assembly protein TadD